MISHVSCTYRRQFCALFLIAVMAPVAVADVDSGLRKCSAIAEDSSRLTCFDALASALVSGRESSPDETPVTSATPAVVVADTVAAATPLSDDVGKERIEAPDADEQPKFSATVTSCRESVQSGQTYFTFENEQVWKQSNYRRLNFRKCDFDVEISKGAFGYEMFIPSKDRSVRIARVR